jgi:KDO2-lipid IV(A) lauroyltransferase
MAWISRLPLAWIHRVGGWLGRLAYAVSGSYRVLVRDNAARAGLDAAQRIASVAHAGRMLAELPWLWLRAHHRPLGALVQWQGAELVDEVIAAGRGLVMLTPHLGCFEVVAQAYAERWGRDCPLTVLYRPARQAWLREWQHTARTRPGLHTAPATLAGVRQMLRALRRGEALGLLPDQVPPEGMGVWVPFFGVPAYTMTLAARLLDQSGAGWLVLWGERLDRGRGWRIHVRRPEPLPASSPGRDDEPFAAGARAINREMERVIGEAPEQYLWGYNRYKQPRKVEAASPDARTQQGADAR